MKTIRKIAEGFTSVLEPRELGINISFLKTGVSQTVHQTRERLLEFDRLIFSLETVSSFSGLNEQLTEGECFPFKQLDLAQRHFTSSESSIFLSYPLIYAIAFGNLEAECGLKNIDLKVLGIPEYEIILSRISAIEDYRHPQFRIRLELFDKFSLKVTPKKLVGSFYTIEGVEKFLTPMSNALIERFESHEQMRSSEEYRNSPAVRKQEYSAIRSLALRTGAQLDTFIAHENVIFLESLPYDITRDVFNRPVISPVLPWSAKELDFSFQLKLERKPDESLPDHILVQTDAQGGRVRVAFSHKAWEEYKFIKSLSAENDSMLEDVVSDPGRYFSTGPRVPIEDIFSDRVAGFILGKRTTNRADGPSGQDWAKGFGENSLILRTGPTSVLRLDSTPTPPEYKVLKDAYKELKNEINKVEATTRADSGLTFTPLPPQLEKRVMIPKFNIEVSLTELHNVCKAIELKNIPILDDDEIQKAMETVSIADSHGLSTVIWKNEEGLAGEIPTDSLRKAIPKVESEGDKDWQVSPELAEKSALKGVPPSWSWKTFLPSQHEGISAFKDGIALKPHQEVGYAWLRWLYEHKSTEREPIHKGALLADDMGLGKTIQLLALVIHCLEKSQDSLPALVVAPVSLINDSWKKDAIEAFTKEGSIVVGDIRDCPIKIDNKILTEEAIRVTEEMADTGKPFHQCAISSSLRNDINRMQEWCKGKLIFCSYETLRSKSVVLASLKFSIIVLDEAQKIKNIGVLQSNAAKALNSDFYVAMTGTPIENSLMDLWSIMDFVCPGHLGDQAAFRSQFLNKVKDSAPGSEGRKNLKLNLENALHPLWLRRLKSEVFKGDSSMPKLIHYDSKTDQNGELINIHEVKMSTSQKNLYDVYMGIFNTLTRGHRLAAIRRLLEVCSSPWLSTDIPVSWENREQLFDLCPKLKTTFDILETIYSGSDDSGRKVVIFANTIQTQISLAYLIADWQRKSKGQTIEVEVFNGEKSTDERSAMLRRFKEKPGFQVLVISPKSGGAGLNITEANHVVHYTREWNPALENQATARCYRIGQQRPVHVYYPTTSTNDSEAPSAEEHLADVLRTKRDVMDDFTISLADQTLSEDAFGPIKSNVKNRVLLSIEAVSSIDAIQFEKLVAILFERKGFKAKWMGQAGDRGADVIVLSDSECYLLQVKHTQKNHEQHTEGVNEVRGAHTVYEELFGRKLTLAVVSNGTFSERAMILSRQGTEVKLWDFYWLKRELESNPIYLEELESVKKFAA